MQTKTKMVNIVTCLITIIFTSCKDFVKIDAPFDQVVTEKVYSSNETASSAIRGIYSNMMNPNGFASGSFYSASLLVGRSADDFVNFQTTELYQQFSNNNLLPDNVGLRSGFWTEPYKLIYAANSVLENLERSNGVSENLKIQLAGEAKFIRAFCHFYLTNLFGKVPLVLTTDYRINAVSFASTKEQIFKQIIKDLLESKSQLSNDYPSGERIRANRWAAAALLARVYLFGEDWGNAELQASEIIAQSTSYSIETNDLNSVFLKNSRESILQFFVPINQNVNTNEGRLYILDAAPGATTEIILSNDLLNAFEPGDLRKSKWIATYTNGVSSWSYPYKYKVKNGATPSSEYSMVLRLAEQYLIRAEARIQQDKIETGISDLNILRARARSVPSSLIPDPLPILPSSLNKAEALLAVEKERRVELFSEWGHRWLDLKRTKRAEAVLSVMKGTNWQSTDVLYPIPLSDLINNPNLEQNAGY